MQSTHTHAHLQTTHMHNAHTHTHARALIDVYMKMISRNHVRIWFKKYRLSNQLQTIWQALIWMNLSSLKDWLVSVACLVSTSTWVLFKWPCCWLTSGQLAENVQQGKYGRQEFFGSIMWGLQLKMTLGMAYWAIHVAEKKFIKLYSTPPSSPYVGTFVISTVPV